MILNLGAGRQQRPDNRWVHLDVKPHQHCDVVADAHCLPFQNESFAAVISQNVFECLDPFQAAAELKRILAPNGMVYVQVAFVLPLTTVGERFRYTADGLRSVFRDWEIVAIGPSAGPLMALARIAEKAVEAALPGRVPAFIGSWCSAWLLHPLKFLDPWILRHDAKGEYASAFSFSFKSRIRISSQSPPPARTAVCRDLLKFPAHVEFQTTIGETSTID